MLSCEFCNFFSEQPFCKTSAFVFKPKLPENVKRRFKKNFYVLTHIHLPKTSRFLFSYLSSNKSKIILKTKITHNKSKFVWNSRDNNKSLGTMFLSKIFFYKIIPTYIFNSLNCCLKSVIYDVYGASTGRSVMGSLVLGFFCNLALIHTESESLFCTLCCVFLIFLLSSNYFTGALIFFYFQFIFRRNVILMIIE